MKPYRSRKFQGYRAKRPRGAWDMTLCIPLALVGDATKFELGEWSLTPHGPKASWDRITWDLSDRSSDRTATVYSIRKWPDPYIKDLGGLRWVMRGIPARGETWALFSRTVACTKGNACPTVTRWDAEYGAPEITFHSQWGCPMAVLEPGPWKRGVNIKW